LRRPDAGRQGTRQRSRLPLPVSPSIPRCPRPHHVGGSYPVAPLSWRRRMSPAGTG
jgi:hypothetical protein